jgi:hypothetical protein
VERLGRVEPTPGHSAWDFLWPVGFRAKRLLSDATGHRSSKATLQINPGPKFVVLLEVAGPGEPPVMVSSPTPDGAMRLALGKLTGVGHALPKTVPPFLPPEVTCQQR